MMRDLHIYTSSTDIDSERVGPLSLLACGQDDEEHYHGHEGYDDDNGHESYDDGH